MATLAARGSGTPVTSGTTWTTTTNLYDGAVGTTPATYAVWTSSTSGATAYIESTGHHSDFAAIPAGSTINSVTFNVRHVQNNATRIASGFAQVYDGATTIGVQNALTTTTTSAATNTFTRTPTLAQLQSSTFKIRVSATRAAVTQSATFSVDYVDVTVDYTAPVPSITQAAYRIYDDGTETGAVALAAQDTPADGDITSGDGIGQLRVRLQSTTAVAVDAADDFQLQWEKNTSGTWANVSAVGITDSYSETNVDSQAYFGDSSTTKTGQSFLGDGKSLVKASFWLRKVGLPTTTIVAELWPHSGTFGSGGVGTGTVIATSTNSYTGAEITTTAAWYEFSFAPTLLTLSTPYVLVTSASLNDASNRYASGADSTGTHPGNRVIFAGSTWTAYPTDGSFIAYTMSGTGTVAAYNSPNLTEGQATTNRLGAGTGSFVAGKVSEDGVVDDLGWGGNNYTELLFPVAIKKPDVVAGDVIRFRILRNGATTGMTYTAVPQVNVVAGAQNIPATIVTTWAWSATAAGVVEHPATDWPGTIATNWGTWTATATGVATTPSVEYFATITSNWGGWTATATGVVTKTGVISTNWSGAGVSHAWNGADPANTVDSQDYELGTKFTVSTPTSCVGIRIRNPGNAWLGAPDDRFAKLWDGVTTTRLKTLNITETMPPGWSEYLWDAPVSLEAAHEYVISYNVKAEGYCQTTHLLDTPVISGPVTLILGQFNSNPGSYPASSYQNSFYGVDVLYGGTGGGWTATAIGTVTHDIPATATGTWGTWTATATGSVTIGAVEYFGTIASTWGPLTATAVATVTKPATITSGWGAMAATATASLDKPATITSGWATWVATASGFRNRPATISSAWGALTATAIGVATKVATASSAWGGWTATAVAVPTHPATVSTTWGGLSASATATQTHPATISTTWAWTATAIGSTEGQAVGTITTNWGTATATAVGKLNIRSTVTTTWNLTATATATVSKPATISSSWGTLTATATGTREHRATVTTSWAGWTATAVGYRGHPATITTAWGPLTATATGQIGHDLPATASATWGPWTATAGATLSVPASITTTWSWTATADGYAGTPSEVTAQIDTAWGAMFATALGLIVLSDIIGMWNGQQFMEWQMGAQPIDEWMMT